ncbi:MAG: hypothetical protein ACNYPG_02040 [Candidatus Porifericomitaceae bacterium WSBS_2022_MAG_OTU9]
MARKYMPHIPDSSVDSSGAARHSFAADDSGLNMARRFLDGMASKELQYKKSSGAEVDDAAKLDVEVPLLQYQHNLIPMLQRDIFIPDIESEQSVVAATANNGVGEDAIVDDAAKLDVEVPLLQYQPNLIPMLQKDIFIPDIESEQSVVAATANNGVGEDTIVDDLADLNFDDDRSSSPDEANDPSVVDSGDAHYGSGVIGWSCPRLMMVLVEVRAERRRAAKDGVGQCAAKPFGGLRKSAKSCQVGQFYVLPPRLKHRLAQSPDIDEYCLTIFGAASGAHAKR